MYRLVGWKALATRRLRAWHVYLAMGVLIAGAYLLSPSKDLQFILHLLLVLSTPVAFVIGILKHRPKRLLPWFLLAFGTLMPVLASLTFVYYEIILESTTPSPSVADMFFIASYPFAAAALLLIQSRRLFRDRASFVDPIIVAVGVGLLSWVFLMKPYANDATLTLVQQLVSMTYPLMDLLLLAVVLRMLLVPGDRPFAFYTLSAGFLCTLAFDTVYGATSLAGTYEEGSLVSVLELLFFILIGVSVLHPSMTRLSDRASTDNVETKLTRRRLALLAVASLMAPGVLALQAVLGQSVDVLAIAGGAAVLFLLVITRMAGMMHVRDQVIEHEKMLRRVAVDLAAAPDRETQHKVALDATRALLGNAPGTQVGIALGSSENVTVEAATTEHSSELAGAQFNFDEYLDECSSAVRAGLLEGRVIEVELSRNKHETQTREVSKRRSGTASFVPLLVQTRLRGAILVITGFTISDSTKTTLEALGREVALSLESADLAEEAHRRKGEKRFRQLFEQSVDALVVHDEQGRIVDCNEETVRSLGYSREELLNLRIKDFATGLITKREDFPEENGGLWQSAMRGKPGELSGVHMGEHRKKDGTTFPVEVRVSPIDYSGERMIFASARDITERVESEKKVREAENRYRTLVEHMPAVTYTERVDGNSSTIYVSSQVEELLGYSQGEWVSNPELWEHSLHPEDRERVMEEHRRTNETGGPFELEYRQLARNGQTVWVRDEAILVRDEYGEPLYWQGVKLDVTKRKQAEEELQRLNQELEERIEERTRKLEAAFSDLWESQQSLRDSEERYSLVVAGSNDGIWDWEVKTGELFWNDRFLEIVGLSRAEAEIDFKLFSDLLHPEDHKRVMDALMAHLERGEKYDEEVRLWHTSDEYRTCIVRGKATRDENGEPVRMAGTVTDITERTLAEEGLRLREQAIEASSNGIVISDLSQQDNPLIYVNPAFERMTGYSAEEALGFNCRFLQGEEQDQPALEKLRAALREGRNCTTILRNRRKDGSLFWNELSVAPVRNRDGRLTHFVGVQTDITERKLVEDEIRQLNENLELRVEERTAQLEEARETAEEASRAKSEFLANMSHEIRTPMNGVIGMTELLLDTRLSDEQREYAETVRRSGDNLLTIINEILDFSKIEAGKVSVETIDFDLLTTVENTVSLLAERAHGKGLELASAVDPGVPTALRGDPSRIRQVLINLLGNAIKFTDEGEIALRVEAAEKDAKRVVRFSVTDTGIGMSEAQQNRLFQAFTQADATTTRKYGGTGLGLAISKQLVELMGGEIGVKSEPGVGSTFYFELPMEKSAGEPLPVQAPRGDGDLRDLRTLIVDDNATNRQILDKQLSSWQMHTASVENASQALEKLRSAAAGGAPYDLAVLDMMMPGMDGLELARQIKADPAIAATHLVLLTSAGKRRDADGAGDGVGEGRKAGIEVYLTKPVRQSALYDALVTVAGGSKPAVPEKAPVSRHSTKEVRAEGGALVLLVEDNAVNQRVAMVMLERLGYRVEVASDGLEALEALSGKCYSAVLMDVQMPNMDGYEATAEIRRREGEASVPENNGKSASGKATNGEHSSGRTPIIAMTANAMAGDREKVLAAGMDDYLSKPVNSEALDELLERWVAPLAPASADVEAANTPDSSDDAGMVLDFAVLEGLRELQEEGEPDIVAELAQMFVEDASSRLTILREAVTEGDASGVERAAHTLKGSSSNMGARGMQEVSAELQKIGTSGDLSGANELLGRLEKEFGRLKPALTAFVEI